MDASSRLREVHATLSCQICFSLYSNAPFCEAFTLPCSHTFCHGCLDRLFQGSGQHRACPLDRKALPKSLASCVRTRKLEEAGDCLVDFCQSLLVSDPPCGHELRKTLKAIVPENCRLEGQRADVPSHQSSATSAPSSAAFSPDPVDSAEVPASGHRRAVPSAPPDESLMVESTGFVHDPAAYSPDAMVTDSTGSRTAGDMDGSTTTGRLWTSSTDTSLSSYGSASAMPGDGRTASEGSTSPADAGYAFAEAAVAAPGMVLTKRQRALQAAMAMAQSGQHRERSSGAARAPPGHAGDVPLSARHQAQHTATLGQALPSVGAGTSGLPDPRHYANATTPNTHTGGHVPVAIPAGPARRSTAATATASVKWMSCHHACSRNNNDSSSSGSTSGRCCKCLSMPARSQCALCRSGMVLSEEAVTPA